MILSPLALATLSLALVTLIQVWREGASITVSLLIFLLAFMAVLASVTSRQSALVVQDRAIVTAENLRHFIMTGKPLDNRLTARQVIALRFASDEEFLQLAAKAAETGMKPNEVKQAIKNWRPDLRRA